MNRSIAQPIDKLIDICWSKTIETSIPKDFIYISQAFGLISLLQDLVCSKELLTTNEKQLLHKMSSDKPLLKLFKHELVPFILRLVKFTDMEKFLVERGGISPYEISKAVNRNSKPFRKPLSPYTMKLNNGKSPARPISTSTPMTYNLRPESKQTISPPQSPVMMRPRPVDRKEINGLRSSVFMKEQQINDRENQYSTVADENNQLSSTNRMQQRKIQTLEIDINNLKKYVETLEYQLERQSINNPNTFKDRNIMKELVNKNSENEKIILHLESLCEKHQKDLTKYKTNDHKYEPIIQKLVAEMNKQDELVEKLKLKLKLNESPSDNWELKTFLKKLPFIKQYYLYCKYQQDQKNFGILFINIATLCLTSVILINILKFVFFIIIYLFDMNRSTSANNLQEYVYDDYGLNNWFSSNEATFVWWKEIEWLEHAIYSLSDWIGS
ncbi:unnamed protein product [Debaryomyces fabryi]|nr:unnamed protein product [Debaryomyces fabryi]